MSLGQLAAETLLSKNRRNRSTRSTGGYSGTPLRPTPLRAAPALPSFRFRPVPSYYRLTRSPASPSVSHLSTVRPPLIRTVFTDTTFRSRGTRRRDKNVVPSHLRSRPSPTLAIAAADRSNPWNMYLDKAWPVLSDQVPLQRAVTCARRSIRREVLLALGRGNGSGSRGIPKSKVRCT